MGEIRVLRNKVGDPFAIAQAKTDEDAGKEVTRLMMLSVWRLTFFRFALFEDVRGENDFAVNIRIAASRVHSCGASVQRFSRLSGLLVRGILCWHGYFSLRRAW